MAAMFVTALAAPEAFGRYGVLFGVSYFVVRLLHVVMFRVVGRSMPDVGAAVTRLVPGMLAGSALILVAGFLTPGWPRPCCGRSPWRSTSGHRWSQAPRAAPEPRPLRRAARARHHHRAGGVAVALGVGVSSEELTPRIVLAVLVGFVAVACLWWLYFDVVAIAAEKRYPNPSLHDMHRAGLEHLYDRRNWLLDL